jgi:hypothetical protein
MEHRQGQVEGRRPGAIVPPLGQLTATLHRNSGLAKPDVLDLGSEVFEMAVI